MSQSYNSPSTDGEAAPAPAPGPQASMPMPGCVARLLYGPARLVSVYVAETLAAAREMSSSSLALVSDMLVKVGGVTRVHSVQCAVTICVQISRGCRSVSVAVLEELMRLYSSSNSSELRNLSTIIVEIMVREK